MRELEEPALSFLEGCISKSKAELKRVGGAKNNQETPDVTCTLEVSLEKIFTEQKTALSGRMHQVSDICASNAGAEKLQIILARRTMPHSV